MMRLLCLVVILSPFGGCNQQVDDIVDQLLVETRPDIQAVVRDQLAVLPDINKSWSKNFFYQLQLTGGLRCLNGSISALGLLKRSGMVRVRWDFDGITLHLPLRLDFFLINYKNCELKLGFVSTSDPIRLLVWGVSFDVQLMVSRRRGRCLGYVEDISVDSIDGLSAPTGSGVMGKLKKSLLEYVFKRYRSSIMKTANRYVKSHSFYDISLAGICEKMYHYLPLHFN